MKKGPIQIIISTHDQKIEFIESYDEENEEEKEKLLNLTIKEFIEKYT
jgi:hypothetical protein